MQLPVKKMTKIVEVISALFIFLFIYTAINKIISVNDLKFVLKKYPLIGSFSDIVAWALPITELIVALFLFIPRTRLLGLYSSLVLMTGFTLYLIYMLSFSSNLPCTCGGMLQKLSWPQHLVFNLIFVILSIVGIVIERRKNKIPLDQQHAPIVFT